MSWFNRARKPCKVIVHFDNLTGEKFDREIIIPDGYTFKCGFAQSTRLLNRNGEVVRLYDWRGGYEITYEFFYD